MTLSSRGHRSDSLPIRAPEGTKLISTAQGAVGIGSRPAVVAFTRPEAGRIRLFLWDPRPEGPGFWHAEDPLNSEWTPISLDLVEATLDGFYELNAPALGPSGFFKVGAQHEKHPSHLDFNAAH